MKPNEEKVEAISKLNPLENTKDLKSFLGAIQCNNTMQNSYRNLRKGLTDSEIYWKRERYYWKETWKWEIE